MQTTSTAQTNGTVTPKSAADTRPEPRDAGYVVTPAIDVYQSADQVLVLVDLPGVSPDALSLDYEKETLTLRARREPRGRERPVTFKRTFTIPREIADEHITAKLDRGVLSLALPKRASSKARSIKVNAG